MAPASSVKIQQWRLPRLLLLSALLSVPACLGIDSAESPYTLTPDAGLTTTPDRLRSELRASLRPAFEIALLAVCGAAAIIITALRCRREERTRLRNIRHLRQFSVFEKEFPEQLATELSHIYARLGGRLRFRNDPEQQSKNEQTYAGITADVQELERLLAACVQMREAGPSLRSQRRDRVDLGALLDELSDHAFESGPLVYSDYRLLRLALQNLVRLTRGRISILDASPEPSGADSRGQHMSREEGGSPAVIIFDSDRDHTLSGADTGLALSRRALFAVGGRLTISTEHSTGSRIEVELPA